MEHVVVEQTFAAPCSDTPVPSPIEDNSLRRMRVFGSRDRLRFVTLYQAPEATDRPGNQAWQSQSAAGTETERHTYPVHMIAHARPELPAGYSVVVVQRDLTGVPGLTVQAVQQLASDPLGCNQRLRLTHIGGYLSQDLSRMVCVYFAPDLEAVRKANRENNVPWEHMWRSEWLHELTD